MTGEIVAAEIVPTMTGGQILVAAGDVFAILYVAGRLRRKRISS